MASNTSKQQQLIGGAVILGVLLVVLLVWASRTHSHSAAYNYGFNLGQNTSGGGGSYGYCLSVADNIYAPVGWSPQQVTDEAHGFIAGCEAR